MARTRGSFDVGVMQKKNELIPLAALKRVRM